MSELDEQHQQAARLKQGLRDGTSGHDPSPAPVRPGWATEEVWGRVLWIVDISVNLSTECKLHMLKDLLQKEYSHVYCMSCGSRLDKDVDYWDEDHDGVSFAMGHDYPQCVKCHNQDEERSRETREKYLPRWSLDFDGGMHRI